LLDRCEELVLEAVGVGLTLLHPIATRDEWAVHLRGVSAARRFRIGSLARWLNAEAGFVDESGHRALSLNQK
jgi:hypothetical protein